MDVHRVILRRSRELTVLLMMTSLVGCTSVPTTRPSSSGPTSGTEPQTVQLKVMEFNIEYGGEGVEFSSVAKAIRAADADVVAIEEAWGNMPAIAADLGWEYDPATQILSRFPMHAPGGAEGRYTLVEVQPGAVAAIANVHLPSSPYSPFKIRDGAKPGDILEAERRVRLEALRPFLHELSTLVRQQIPVFLVGDFNAPSHLDWTEAAVGIREHVRYPLAWPVSRAVERAGFMDSFRDVHPDPVSDQGITWPASRPFVKGYNPGRNGAAADRIDFVYAAGPAIPVDSFILGEPDAHGVDVVVEPWPSDHRALVSVFEVTPASPPVFVSVTPRLVDAGGDVRVAFNAPTEWDAHVTVIPAGGAPSEALDVLAGGGAETLSTDGWPPGGNRARLVDGSGETRAAASYWVREPEEGAVVSTKTHEFGVGEPIIVLWRNAPGNRWDWVGIYRRGADPNVAYYLQWAYTEASIVGAAILGEDANGPWPLKPGAYSVYLLEDDGYETLAAATFRVRP